MMHARIVRTLTEMRVLERDWHRLANARPDPFLSYWWIFTWFEHFGDDMLLHLVVLEREQGEVAGIVPLLLACERRRQLRVRVLRSLVRRSAGPARSGILCAPDDEEAAIESFIGFLAQDYREWDVLEIEGLSADGAQLSLLIDAAARQRFTLLAPEEVETARVLAVKQRWAEYVRNRGKHFRRRLIDERHRLDRTGVWSFVAVRAPEDIARAMKDVVTILAKHFHLERIEDDQLDRIEGLPEEDRRVLAFAHNIVLRFAAFGAIDLRILRINDRPAACLLSLVADGIVYPLLTKYDPAFGAASAGRAVFVSLFEDAAERGYREIDFLSNWDYLARVTDQTRVYVKLTAFHSGWYSQAVRIEREVISPWLRRLLTNRFRKAPEGGA